MPRAPRFELAEIDVFEVFDVQAPPFCSPEFDVKIDKIYNFGSEISIFLSNTQVQFLFCERDTL